MKELSIEEKAKAYDEALERMKSWARGEHPECFTEAQKTAEFIFPELCESKDERIRKELIEFVKSRGGFKQEYIAWLEKQGEHKKFRDSIQVGDEVTRNSDGVIVNLPQLKRVAKKSEQKLPIEKLPSEMKTIRESLGFTTQEECDEYNEMVTNLIMGDDDKGEQKTALSEEELTDFEKSLKHVMEETLECGDIHNLKADADLLLRLVKPTDDDMKEALRTEYEKGRADAFAQMQKEWSEEDEKMVANLVDYFKVDDALQYTEKQVVDWLKSLKGRAQPQPKQEWSEEDQNALEDVREAVVHYWGGDTQDILLYWLKSIKQKIKGE